MANHSSAIKKIRSDEAKKARNKYQAKTTRNAVRKLRTTTDKAEAESLLKSVSAMLDKLAKRNVIHKNNASNKKSSLTKYVNALSTTKSAEEKPKVAKKTVAAKAKTAASKAKSTANKAAVAAKKAKA